MTRFAVALLALASLAPLAAEAQPARTVPRIGLLDASPLDTRQHLWEAFRQGMRQLGYVEGRNVTFEIRSAEGDYERLPALAAELVRLKVDVIVASGTAAHAARQATATIPIVTSGGNPLTTGAVASLARPGGNVTGVTTLTGQLSQKRLEVARDLIPGASRLAILWNAESAGAARAIQETESAARALGLRVDAVSVQDPNEIEAAVSAIAQTRPAALIVMPSGLFFGQRRRVAELARMHRLPTVHGQREFVEAGGLVAYGTNLAERFHRAAGYVDKILKGARPGNLPIDQPTTFELVINLKTARELGLTIPPSILARATDVIE